MYFWKSELIAEFCPIPYFYSKVQHLDRIQSIRKVLNIISGMIYLKKLACFLKLKLANWMLVYTTILNNYVTDCICFNWYKVMVTLLLMCKILWGSLFGLFRRFSRMKWQNFNNIPICCWNVLFCFILTIAITPDCSLKKMSYNMGKLDKKLFSW